MTELTDEQSSALAFLNRFVQGTERMACLAGYAGVGKTHLVSYWLASLDPRLRLCIAAPTHQALGVLNEKCRGGRPLASYTLAALLGEAPADDPETGESQFVQINERKDGEFDLIVVDECSMVNVRTFEALASSPAKLLFVGDPAQLPPVRETQESRSCSVPTKFQMTTIVRQPQGNPIIELSLMIRQKQADPGFVLVDDMRAAMTDDRRRFTICARDDLRQFAEWAYRSGWRATILAFKNETVIAHNMAIHSAFYPGAPIFAPGETMLAYENKWEDGAPVLYNGEIVTCLSCDPAGDLYGLRAYRVTVKRGSGAVFRFRVAEDDLKLDAMRKRASRLAAGLRHSAHVSPSKKLEYFEAVRKRDYLKGFARLRHSYACTVHKSQGSTYDAVFMDWADIASARDPKMHYVAVTRAADCLVVAA